MSQHQNFQENTKLNIAKSVEKARKTYDLTRETTSIHEEWICWIIKPLRSLVFILKDWVHSVFERNRMFRSRIKPSSLSPDALRIYEDLKLAIEKEKVRK